MPGLTRPILALVLALAGCAKEAPPPARLRAPDAPIYSSAVLDPARLEGTWRQVAAFVPSEAPCAPGGLRVAGGLAEWNLCLADGAVQGAGPLTPGLPGRLAVPGMADWWVLWVDADYRTLLVGTPGGEFGFVLDRGDSLPPDRVQAVSDIAVFNGYRAGDLALF